MKTKHILLGAGAVLLTSLGGNVYQLIANNAQKAANDELAAEVDRYGNLYSPVYQYFTALTVEEFKAKVASGERFTVYIGRPDCGDCSAFEPGFEEMINEENLRNKMYYLNVRWLHDGPTEDWEAFKKEYGFTQTPAFSTYKDGKQESMIEWSSHGLLRSELTTWLEKQGIM